MKRRLKLLFAAWTQRYVSELFRRNPQAKLVAVGGSIGKTSTKLAIATVLGQKYRVSHHEGNYNDLISIPLSILNLPVPPLYNPWAWLSTWRRAAQIARQPYPFDVVVVELGTDQPGDIPAFMKHLHPDIGVVTGTSPEHIEMFKTFEAVIAEELTLARGSRVAIVNADDAGIQANLDNLAPKVITYGQTGQARFTVSQLKATGLAATLAIGRQEIPVQTHVIASHSLYALAAAAAVGQELGLSGEQIKAGIAAFKPVAGRMNPLKGINGSLIIDDSYNASPDAVIAALESLNQLSNGRQIAILGSMNELGDYGPKAHQEVGAACGKLNLLVTIGRDAQDYLVPAALQAGLKPDQVKSFLSPYEAGQFLKSQLKAGDTVLVKGSQNGVFSEEAAAQLLADSADKSKLVRQSPEWQAKKRAQFSHE